MTAFDITILRRCKMENTKETKPKITIILQFEDNVQLLIESYNTIDIQRDSKHLYINVTNTCCNFEFNQLYNKILENLNNNKTFNIAFNNGDNRADFEDVTANYHFNFEREILSFKQIKN